MTATVDERERCEGCGAPLVRLAFVRAGVTVVVCTNRLCDNPTLDRERGRRTNASIKERR